MRQNRYSGFNYDLITYAYLSRSSAAATGHYLFLQLGPKLVGDPSPALT